MEFEMTIKPPGASRRLRMLQTGSKTKVVDRIRPDCLEKVESDVNKKLPISATEAEVTNYLLHYEENHPDDFVGVAFRGGQDFKKMTNLRRWEIGNEIEEAKAAAAKVAAAEAAAKAAAAKFK
jgi:hypothetical protein